MSEEQHGLDALNQNKVIKYNSMQIITYFNRKSVALKR